jgi:hypothetical protein
VSVVFFICLLGLDFATPAPGDVLPVGVIPVTTVVTILSYGDAPTATVQLTNGQSRAITLDTIADFVDERRNPRNTRGAAVVDVVFPSDILREGLCLVDTPGLGSVHATKGALESYLRRLSMTARDRLVGHAGARAVGRLGRRVASELTRRQDALRRPLVELEARLARLRQALADLDRALIELRFRFDAAEADLGAQFEQRRTRFIESTEHLRPTLMA